MKAKNPNKKNSNKLENQIFILVSHTSALIHLTSETSETSIQPMEEPSPGKVKEEAKLIWYKPSKEQQFQLNAMNKSDSDIGTEPVINTATDDDAAIIAYIDV